MKLQVVVNGPQDGQVASQVLLRSGGEADRVVDVTFIALPPVPMPTELGKDLLLIGSAVYGVDKIVNRRLAVNAWTRDIELEVPVSNVARWNKCRSDLTLALQFLTGDRWKLTFVKRSTAYSPGFGGEATTWGGEGIYNATHISLFSGGLDSLAGVIDELDDPASHLLLVGHFDPHQSGPKTDQDDLFPKLEALHGSRVARVLTRAWIHPKGGEITLRGRSFLFLSLAACLASGYGEGVPIVVPENGVIAINPPLSPSRRGSCSTRTTHPYFLEKVRPLLFALGIANEVQTPLFGRTKGEIVSGCLAPQVLAPLIPFAVSCGKRNRKMHWIRRTGVHHCGCCLPCIFRRAGLYGQNVQEAYGVDFCDPAEFDVNHPSRAVPEDLRAALHFVRTCRSLADAESLLRSAGGLLSAEVHAHAPVIERAAAEVRAFLDAEAPADIRALAV